MPKTGCITGHSTPIRKIRTAVRKVEQHLSYAARYKGTDGFGPAGPWLVTADAVPDPHDLDISCSVAGEIFTDDNTRHYTYRVEEVLAFISRFMTLEAGDMISMAPPSVPRRPAAGRCMLPTSAVWTVRSRWRSPGWAGCPTRCGATRRRRRSGG